ncbi:MAG: hypothetical protein U0168_20600 [Nannocystaceae bacterium]
MTALERAESDLAEIAPARDLGAAHGGNDDAGQRARRNLLEVDAALDDLEQSKQWPELEQRAVRTMTWAGNQVSQLGTDREQALFEEITQAASTERGANATYASCSGSCGSRRSWARPRGTATPTPGRCCSRTPPATSTRPPICPRPRRSCARARTRARATISRRCVAPPRSCGSCCRTTPRRGSRASTRGPMSDAAERWARNPFYVLDLPSAATRAELERAGQG